MTEKVCFLPADQSHCSEGERIKLKNRVLEHLQKYLSEKTPAFIRLTVTSEQGQDGPSLLYLADINAIVYADEPLNPFHITVTKDRYYPYLSQRDRSDTPMPFLQTSTAVSLRLGIMHWDEYQPYCDLLNPRGEKSVCLLNANNITSVNGKSERYYFIPLHRIPYDRTSSLASVLDYFLRSRLRPVFQDAQCEHDVKDYFASLFPSGNNGVTTVTDRKGIDKKLTELKESDSRRANLPIYSDAIFSPTQGLWDLYEYVGLQRSSLPTDRTWYDISSLKPPIYARNPEDSLVCDSDYAAIDFGTTSTTVAVNLGNVHLLKSIGPAEKLSSENPTIVQFQDIASFLSAYRTSAGRPDTVFDHIPVSTTAEHNFETAIQKDEPLDPFMNDLKQWADNPHRSTRIIDNEGQVYTLCAYPVRDDEVNPIELYAYYIGLYLNNLQDDKLYLKYYLTYSATFIRQTVERIRDSFQRGLTKSLPTTVTKRHRVEVIAQLDEATAYAISAWSEYYRQAADGMVEFPHASDDANKPELPKKSDYDKAFEESGLLYGVFDMGGGTLDLSFGTISKGEEDTVKIEPLSTGGSSFLGCESMLQELAFRFFNLCQNDISFRSSNVKCLPSERYPQVQNNSFISNSFYARSNTNYLINQFRWQFWTKNDTSNNNTLHISLLSETGEKYRFNVSTGVNGAGQKNEENNTSKEIPIDLSSPLHEKPIGDVVENWFCEQINEGIILFLEQYNDLINTHEKLKDKPLFIFLGGNGSRAPRVQKCFQMCTSKDSDIKVYLHPPLPTSLAIKDEHKNKTGALPQAKSGVVLGLLRYLCGNYEVEQSQLRQRIFPYHIGIRKYNLASPYGLFDLKVSASEFLPRQHYKLCTIPQKRASVSILYTREPRYGFRRNDESMLSAEGVQSLEINLNGHGGKALFCRIRETQPSLLILEVEQLCYICDYTCDLVRGTVRKHEYYLAFQDKDKVKPLCPVEEEQRYQSLQLDRIWIINTQQLETLVLVERVEHSGGRTNDIYHSLPVKSHPGADYVLCGMSYDHTDVLTFIPLQSSTKSLLVEARFDYPISQQED